MFGPGVSLQALCSYCSWLSAVKVQFKHLAAPFLQRVFIIQDAIRWRHLAAVSLQLGDVRSDAVSQLIIVGTFSPVVFFLKIEQEMLMQFV